MDKWLRLNEVMYLIGYSCDFIWRNEKKGLFPKRFKIDKYHARWSANEVLKWIEENKSCR